MARQLPGHAGSSLPFRFSQIGNPRSLAWGWTTSLNKLLPKAEFPDVVATQFAETLPYPGAQPGQIDPFYLFACHVEWERRSDPSAGWELISAAQSSYQDTRAHARALLARSEREPATLPAIPGLSSNFRGRPGYFLEGRMKTPYGLNIIDTCTECSCRAPGFFCGLPANVLKSFDQVSQHSILPAGAILFVEGQIPRGVFVLCSGKVKLSTTSREGKVLILKIAEAGEPLGLSAAISGECYEMTAETAMPCQLNFVDRKNLLNLLEAHPEVGMQAAQSLSREFQAAYRDIHDLVLSRSSAGKLARLLLSCSPERNSMLLREEIRLRSAMTHEEMAQRIGSSRETVTRLLSELKKRQLIRIDGATLVIRNRTALEALAV